LQARRFTDTLPMVITHVQVLRFGVAKMSDFLRYVLAFFALCSGVLMISSLYYTSNILAEVNEQMDKETAKMEKLQAERATRQLSGFENSTPSIRPRSDQRLDLKSNFKMGDPTLNPAPSSEFNTGR
jgi:hypothetical protein